MIEMGPSVHNIMHNKHNPTTQYKETKIHVLHSKNKPKITEN